MLLVVKKYTCLVFLFTLIFGHGNKTGADGVGRKTWRATTRNVPHVVASALAQVAILHQSFALVLLKGQRLGGGRDGTRTSSQAAGSAGAFEVADAIR
jgi:hypothetical protein